MLGKTNKLDWHYDKIRCFLFLNSAGYKILISKLRVKYDLQNRSEKERQRILNDAYLLNKENGIFHDIEVLAKKLSLPRLFIEKSLAHDAISNHMLGQISLPIYIATETDALTEGFFIKIDENTSKETIETARHFLHKEFLLLNKYLSPREKKMKPRQRDDKPDRLNHKVDIFCSIEACITKRYKEAELNKIVNESILDAVDLKISSKKDNSLEHFTAVYYQILRYFKIPSYQQFTNSYIKSS